MRDRAFRTLAKIAAFVTILPLSTLGFAQERVAIAPSECARLLDLQIDKQANPRAGRLSVACSERPVPYAVAVEPFAEPVQGIDPGALAGLIGGSDVNLITTPDDVFPAVTQAGSMVWGNGTDVVVVYTDTLGAPSSFSGMSVSTDSGINFDRLDPDPFGAAFSDDFGSPAVAYDDSAGVWLAVTLTSDCGSQGIGVMSSATPADPAVPASWAAIPCAHTGTAADRPILWVDNDSGSAFYGRRYIAFNDFAAGGILKVVYSDGGPWTEKTVDMATPLFIRNVHITGGSDSVSGDDTVFIFGMDEGGGGDNNRSNWVYKSTNGGVTWGATSPGPSYQAAGAGLCAASDYFNMIPPVWRHMGWGQGAVGPGGVVHYVYTREGQVPGDIGDIYYIRSPDNGVSWETAIPLNTDQAANNNVVQWQPAISVTSQGSVLATWYDKRNTTDGFNYEYYGRLSLDNGATFLPDEPISDLMIPQPTQVDANLPFCFAGDSNFHGVLDTATVNASLVTWTDGRNIVNDGVQDVEQMDVYFDRVPLCPKIDVLPDALPNGEFGTPYAQTLSASGGTAPYSFVLAGDLASFGLDLVGANITGMPTATGIVGFSIVATDNFGCTASQEYNLIVDPGGSCPTIMLTPTTLPNAAQGAPYSEFIVASGGSGSYAYSVSSGELPSGLTLNSGTGEIAGVPAESGLYDLSITATDTSTQCTGTQSYTSATSLSVDCPFISLSPASLELPDMFAGVPYLTNITANGGTAPYKFKELGGTTHTNIFFGEGGTIFGVPESGGTKQPLIQAIDVNGCASSSLNEDAKFRMTSKNCFDGAILCDTLSDTTINFTTVDHCGGEAGWYGTNACPSSADIGHDVAAHARWGTNDPAEDCFDYGAGKTQDSLDSIVLDVSNCNSGEVILRFNYLLGFEEDHTNDRARVEVVADGGAPEVVADNGAGGPACSGEASPGLRNLRNWSGWQHIEITHSATSTFAVSFYGETDNGTANAGEGFLIDDVNVQCKCADDQIMTPDTLAPTVVGSPYSVTFVTTGGVPPYSYNPPPGGGVPSGLVLNEFTGVLSGTTDTTGILEFTVVSTDDNFCTVSTFFSLVVSATGCPAITLSPTGPALLDGQETVFYSDVVTAGGGIAPHTYSVSAGALPPGLSLDPDSGVISGTATTAGTYPFTVSAQDFNLCVGSRDYTIVIAALVCPVIDITPEILPNASKDVPYSEQLIAAGGTAPYTWLSSTGTLPAGITLDSSGLLSGTPTEDAAFLFAVTVQDANGCFGDLGYNIDVLCTLELVITSPTMISGLFQACNSITASGVQVVNPGATFRAGSLIVLGNGFSVATGADFTTIIDSSLIPPP